MIKILKPIIKKVEGEKGKISNNMRFSLNTKDIKEENNMLLIDFDFLIDYGGAKLKMSGIVAARGNEEEIKLLKNYWNQNKKLKEEFFVIFYNFLMTTLINKIAMMADLLDLPLPLNLPLLKLENLKKADEASDNKKIKEIDGKKDKEGIVDEIDKNIEELNEEDLEKIE